MPVTLYCMMGKQRADTCLFSSQVIRLKGKVLPELYPRDHIRIQDVLSSKTLHAGILANRPRLGVRCSQYQFDNRAAVKITGRSGFLDVMPQLSQHLER